MTCHDAFTRARTRIGATAGEDTLEYRMNARLAALPAVERGSRSTNYYDQSTTYCKKIESSDQYCFLIGPSFEASTQ
eukprot:scaffold31717_cov56-Attheya_sp.AAC.1